LGHLPHASVPPQPSDTEPQLSPSAAHVVGVQPHWFGTPEPPHICPDGHAPQLRVPPQPSGAEPHVSPRPAHVFAVHGVFPQTFPVPPARLEQISPLGHIPQLRTPPQPSEIVPHCEFVAAHVVGAPEPVHADQVPPDSPWPMHDCVPNVHEPTPACDAEPV